MKKRTANFKIKGTLRVVIRRDGVPDELLVYENRVVNNGRSLVVDLLATGNADAIISKIGFGEGTAAVNNGDSSLTNPFLKGVDGFTSPAFNSVEFSWDLGMAEGNGMTITEYGLFSETETMFARVVRGTIVKDNTFSLAGTWTVEIT